MNERAVLAIFSITALIGAGVIGVSRSSYIPVSKSVADVQVQTANYKLSSYDRMAELSAYRLAADMILFFEMCDASSISAVRQGVILSKFGYMPDAILREEAKKAEKKRIDAIPPHETLPGGWISFCRIMSDNVARGLYHDNM